MSNFHHDCAQSSSEDGEMEFCRSCPKMQNCCTRIGNSGRILPPFLFPGEEEAIIKLTALARNDVCNTHSVAEGGTITTIKSTEPGCIFNVDGLCKIYHHRPFDCRLFPFDIREKEDGRLVWIVYKNLCPVAFDYQIYFPKAKVMFRRLITTRSDLMKFIRYGRQTMYGEEVIEIEELKFEEAFA